MLTPYDVAIIYNILPLWRESTPINGKGVKVAIVGLSDVVTSDVNTFRKSFALPAGTLTTIHNGADPGLTNSQGENTEDVEMVSATAPGAQVVLVSSINSQTTNGLILGITYIADNEIAPILSMSYGECELSLGRTPTTGGSTPLTIAGCPISRVLCAKWGFCYMPRPACSHFRYPHVHPLCTTLNSPSASSASRPGLPPL